MVMVCTAAPGRVGRKVTVGYVVSVASWEQEKQATVASRQMGEGLAFPYLPHHFLELSVWERQGVRDC